MQTFRYSRELLYRHGFLGRRRDRSCRESRAISSLMCPCRPWMETRPADAASMAGLEVAPIDTVTLSDRLSQDNRRCPPVLDRLLWSGPRKTA